MKQSILLYAILFFMSISMINTGLCQVTIEAEDFARTAVIVDDGIVANTAGVLAPTHGANQVWDYSGLTTSRTDTTHYFDASGNVFFSDALNYKKSDLTFQGLLIESNLFEDVDEQGFYEVGRVSADVHYSITAISGGPTDTLAFVGNQAAHDGRIDFIQFPLNYADQWNQSRIETINFELSVAAFGLNHTPGNRQRHVTQNREVVGYGQIIIPTADGTASTPMDVLLVHVLESQVDTFYVGGALAPPTLLGAFGLTQGASVSDEFYVFYRPGFAAPVMNFDVTTAAVYYRPRAAEGVSSIRPINKINVHCYPNPVVSGEHLSFQSVEIINGGQIQLVDMIGRIIYQRTFSSAADEAFKLNIPTQLSKGMYTYRILDKHEGFLNSGSIFIE